MQLAYEFLKIIQTILIYVEIHSAHFSLEVGD